MPGMDLSLSQQLLGDEIGYLWLEDHWEYGYINGVNKSCDSHEFVT